jgi:putative phage-type endonuclease
MGALPKGVSGSRIAGICGLSKFTTPVAVWQEIMEELEPGWNAAHGYTLPEREESAAMRWGLCFENSIAGLSERATGLKITDRERFFEKENMTCHVDGIFSDGDLYEAKTTSRFMWREDWGEPMTDRVPSYYQAQLQWNMCVAGLERARLFVLCWPETPDAWEKMGWYCGYVKDKTTKWLLQNDELKTGVEPEAWAKTLAEMGYFHQYPVAANEAAQKGLLGKYRDFWHNHVIPGIPPEPRNFDDVKRLFPEPRTTVVVPEYIERKLLEYKMIVEETAQAKKAKERIKTIAAKYAAGHGGTPDDESREAVIFRSASGKKLGQWSRKMFRVS